MIEPDVLSKDRVRFEASGDETYIDKAHRRGKVGRNVGGRMESRIDISAYQIGSDR